MARIIIVFVACLLWSVLTAVAQAATVSVLVDLGPNSAAQTVVVESIAADGKTSLDGIGASIIKIEP